MTLADVVHRFKTMTTKRYVDGVNQAGWPGFRGRLWQRNYYEHIIRDDESLARIREYIADNPLNWATDEVLGQPRGDCPYVMPRLSAMVAVRGQPQGDCPYVNATALRHGGCPGQPRGDCPYVKGNFYKCFKKYLEFVLV